MLFDSSSVHLCIDSCVIGGITGFKSHFIEELNTELAERSSYTTECQLIIISEGVEACALKDDNAEHCILKTNMSCGP